MSEWNAVLAALAVSVSCASIGFFLVLKRMAFFGVTLAHAALAGIALSAFFAVDAAFLPLLLAVLVAVAVQRGSESRRASGDLALSVAFALSLAVAVAAFAASGTAFPFGAYALGGLESLSENQRNVALLVAAYVLFMLGTRFTRFSFTLFDPETAVASGIRTRNYNFLLLLFAGAAAGSSLPLAGVLLTTAYLVFPAAAALQLRLGFLASFLYAVFTAVLATLAGAAAWLALGIPPTTAVLVALAALVALSAAFGRVVKTK